MIYLDNAATSYPKPREVLNAACAAVCAPFGNPGRSGHILSKRSAEAVFSAREAIARLLGLTKSENIVFTGGATAALNLAVLGAVEEIAKYERKPYVVTSVFEHNSVLRPLFYLEKRGRIRLRLISPEKSGHFSRAALLSPPPHIFVLTLRSNVTGRSFDTSAIASLLAPYGTLIIGDGAQAVGGSEAAFHESGVHILCAPGHKGLLGIMGGGFLAVSDHCPITPEAIFSGGSGSDTFNPEMPAYLPERLEAGTLPLPAIVSMEAGARFLLRHGVSAIARHERERKAQLIRGLRVMGGYTLYEPYFPDGPLLINRVGIPSEEASAALSEKGLLVRGGFHCAPLAHRFLGTERWGAIRLSPGPFTTKEEIEEALNILESIK